MGFPYTVRGPFLIHNDNSRALEIEDLGEVQQPKQWFTKPVRMAVFVYGSCRKQQHAAGRAADHPDVPIPDLLTDIS